MRNGVVSQRPPLEPVTDVNASGYWPTTTTMDSVSSGGNPNTTGTHGTTLTDRAVRMWPTVTATDAEGNGMRSGSRSTEPKLAGAARMWHTRNARDPKGEPGPASTYQSLPRQVNQHGRHHLTTTTAGNDGEHKADLNPRFVAALMGVPWDWLNPCTSVATDSFHEWQRKHSPNWRLVLASDER